MQKLIPTIGIEVHVELKTNSKVFSNSQNSYGEIANIKTNIIDLGYPGTLPILNKEVIDATIKIALALNCKIQREMYFDRKNYFYPDLPKGFQITQSSTPLGYDGYIEIEVSGKKKRIGIERVHIEEDTCKSIHDKEKTLLDFNRAGIPLVEIVTKPVIENENETIIYLEKLRELLLYIGVSDVKIEEGSMRCDANISLKEEDSAILGTKTEIKNIGSISNVKSSIIYEIERQKTFINNGSLIREETRRYDEKTGTTILMRVKETINDYRYFPEPDIPYIKIDDQWIKEIEQEMPILPDELRKKYKELKINDISINTLIQNKDLSHFFSRIVEMGANPVISSNLLTGDVLAYLNKHNINIGSTKLNDNSFKELVDMLAKNIISSKIGKEVLRELLINGGTAELILGKNKIEQINDFNELLKIVSLVIENNPESIVDYKKGHDRALKHLMGSIMKESKGQANPLMVKEILIDELKKR